MKSKQLIVFFILAVVSLPLLTLAENQKENEVNFEMQERCSKITQEFMKNENFEDDSVKFENHFSKLFNKCFVRVESFDKSKKIIAYSLVDVIENKDYGSCLEIEYKVHNCWVAGQYFNNYYSWKDASEKYMNE